jgi:hypothetical protein
VRGCVGRQFFVENQEEEREELRKEVKELWDIEAVGL